jgi:hypothetical protein
MGEIFCRARLPTALLCRDPLHGQLGDARPTDAKAAMLVDGILGAQATGWQGGSEAKHWSKIFTNSVSLEKELALRR